MNSLRDRSKSYRLARKSLLYLVALSILVTGCGTKAFEKPLTDFEEATSALLTLTSETYSDFQEVRRERHYLEYWTKAGPGSYTTEKIAELLNSDIAIKKELEDDFDKKDIKVRKAVISELQHLIKLLTRLTQVDPQPMADSFKVSGERLKALGEKFGAGSQFNKSLTTLGTLVGTTFAQAVQRRKYRIVRETLKKMEPEVSTIVTLLEKDLDALYELYQKDLTRITGAYTNGLLLSIRPGVLTVRKANPSLECKALKECIIDDDLSSLKAVKAEILVTESHLNAPDVRGNRSDIKLSPIGLLAQEDRGLSFLLSERLEKHHARVALANTRRTEHSKAIKKMGETFKKLADTDVSSSVVVSQLADYLEAVDDFITTMEAVEESE